MENKRIIRDNLLFSLKKLIHTMEFQTAIIYDEDDLTKLLREIENFNRMADMRLIDIDLKDFSKIIIGVWVPESCLEE